MMKVTAELVQPAPPPKPDVVLTMDYNTALELQTYLYSKVEWTSPALIEVQRVLFGACRKVI